MAPVSRWLRVPLHLPDRRRDGRRRQDIFRTCRPSVLMIDFAKKLNGTVRLRLRA